MLDATTKLAVLRRATALLASARNFDEIMEQTIASCLPSLGDFGFFDLDVGGSVKRTARAFEDARVDDILRPTQWIRQERTDMNLCALSTGRAALHADIDDVWYQAIAVNDGHLQVLRDLGFVSMITVPMRYQDDLLGALTLFFGRSGQHFGDDHLELAIDLANLAAPVVANVRLLEQQRRITAALQTSEERLRVGMDAGELGVWDWDVRADRITWSDRVYDLHGVARDQFTGTVDGFAQLIHPDDREGVGRAIEAALVDGAPYTVEFRVPTASGVRWLTTRAEVYRDAQGQPLRMVGATFDVTERRAMLDEMAQARRDAEAANRAKDEFLAMLGHELRNPLAPIASALSLMEMADASAFRRERAIIQRQTDHMVRLVDDLLDVARITRGKISLVREPFDLVSAVESIVDASRANLAKQRQTIAFEAEARPIMVDGDRVRIAQVVGNLVANAAKFSPPGEHIGVRIALVDGDVELSITDRGVGIAPDLLPKVFDLFVQGAQALDRERGGLGVGLAIVANVVALHGGRVAAESDGPGRGATFRVRLPVVADVVEAARTPASAPAGARPLRILVVDDNLDAGELVGDLLRTQRHAVHVSTSSQAALAVLAERAFDVAILDIGLPQMDGYQLAAAIRARVAGSIHLVALTGYGLATDRERTRAAGFDAHFVKPVAPVELFAHLAAIAASA